MLETMPLTLGTSVLGDRGDDREIAALADAILASPLGHVDTSNNYAGGRSEAHLGAAIARAGGLGDTLVYSKADLDAASGAFDGDRVRRSLDESLEKLGLDHLPVYHLHDPYTVSISEAMAPGGAVEALLDLRDQGVIGSIGVAAGKRDLVLEYVLTDAFDAVLSHNRFTLADRTATPIFEAARERNMVVFNAAPFGGGVLADPSKDKYSYRPMPEPFAAFVDALRSTAAEFNVDLVAAALQFSMRSPLVDSTIVGITTIQRLEQLERLATAEVPEEFFVAVDRLGTPPESVND
jgi:D-threo-aldose 1-dehydrogenase